MIIYEDYLRYHVRAAGIKSHPDTTGCDKISLTHKTPFRILNSRKSNFLSISIEEVRCGGKWKQLMEALSIVRDNLHRFSHVTINMTVRRENYQEIPEFIQMGERFGFNVSFSESMILANTDADPSLCFFDDPQSDTFKHFVRIAKA